MIKKNSKGKITVSNSPVLAVEKPIKKKGFFKHVFFLVVLLGALYFLKGLFIVAVVNGRPISRIGLVSSIEKKYGQQALDELISKNLILSEASAKGIRVGSEEVSSEINKIREIVKEQGSTLEEALLSQGQTMTDLEENIKIQKIVEKLLGESIAVTDDEAKAYFEENKATFEEGTNFDDIKTDLINSLKQQKMGVEFDKWLTEKKNSAKIMYFVDFN